jgi:hypothetical protein
MVFFGGRERYERLAKGYARFEQVCPAATRTSTAMAVRRRYERLDEGMRGPAAKRTSTSDEYERLEEAWRYEDKVTKVTKATKATKVTKVTKVTNDHK